MSERNDREDKNTKRPCERTLGLGVLEQVLLLVSLLDLFSHLEEVGEEEEAFKNGPRERKKIAASASRGSVSG